MRSTHSRKRPAHLLPRWIAAGAVLVGAGVMVAGGMTVVASADDDDRRDSVHAPKLPEGHTHGSEAIEALGKDLGQAAADRGITPAQLRAQLKADDALRVDAEGDLYWADADLVKPDSDTPEPPKGRDAKRLKTGQAATPRVATALTEEQAFTLHSNPSAAKAIYLNFRGWTVPADTYYDLAATEFGDLRGKTVVGWEAAVGATPDYAKVEEAWKVAAELFSAWDVDVTTENPGDAKLTRTSPADTTYGVEVVVTPDFEVWRALGGNNGLSAAAFGDVDTRRQVVLVHADANVYRPKWSPTDVAAVGVHEVGHSLGLSHHEVTINGDTGNYGGYLAGLVAGGSESFDPIHNWSPIMGSIGTPLIQWSKREYIGANNPAGQDDLAIIGRTLGVRADEAPSSAAGAAALPASTAYITSDSDVDSWLLGQCTANATVTVTPATHSPALDVEASLVRRGTGTVVETANPPTYLDWDYNLDYGLRGMDASLVVPAAGDDYVLQVRGGGDGDWADGGYGAYGSIGQYTIAVDGCSTAGVPAAPANLSADAHVSGASASVDLSWDASGAAEYIVAVGEEEFTTSAAAITVEDLQLATTYTFTVTAVNAGGHSRPAEKVVTIPAGVPGAPEPLSITTGSGQATLSWAGPDSDGGSPVQEYKIYLDGSPTPHATVPADLPPWYASNSYNLTDQGGTSTVTVAAVSAGGEGAQAAFAPIVWGATAPPAVVKAVARDGSATVSWKAPQVSHPSYKATSYTVTASSGGGTAVTPDGGTTQVVVPGLTNGAEYTFTVTATNANGTSAPSAPSKAVTIGVAPVTADNVARGVVNQPVEVTLDATDEGGSTVARTTYTIGTEDTPAADPRVSGAVYDDSDKPVLSNGQYIRYSSEDAAGNEEQPKTSATAKVAARVAAPVLTAAANKVGQTVTATVSGVSPVGATPAYEWRRRGLPGSDWQIIAGVTGSSYTLQAADAGHQISVTATVAAAGYRSASATSLASVVIVGSDDTPSGAIGGSVSDQSFRTKVDSDNNGGTGPNDVAADDDGFVYVPNEGNRRIQKFNAAGDLVDTWPAPPGGAHHTYFSAVDAGGPDDHIYAVDANNHRVLEYDTDGALVRRWPVPGADQMLLMRQFSGITVDDVGNVYVSDTPFGVVQKFGPDGAFRWKWTVPGASEVKGLAVLNGTLYVADGGVVRMVNAETKADLGSWNGVSTGGEAFTSPTDIALDGEDNLYVLDGNGYRIQKFGSDRAFVKKVTAANPLATKNASGLDIGVNGQAYVAVNYPDEGIEMLGDDSVQFVPDAPTAVVGTTGDTKATVTWTVPANTNGRPVTGYTVIARFAGSGPSAGPTSDPRATVSVGAGSLTAAVPGLYNGSSYIFTVKATNAAGDSVESAVSNTVVPAIQAAATSVEVEFGGSPVEWQPKTLTATVTPSNAVGHVKFKDGDMDLATVTVVDGVASFDANSYLLLGSHSITATFVPWGPGGWDHFLESVSTPLSVTITPVGGPTDPDCDTATEQHAAAVAAVTKANNAKTAAAAAVKKAAAANNTAQANATKAAAKAKKAAAKAKKTGTKKAKQASKKAKQASMKAKQAAGAAKKNLATAQASLGKANATHAKATTVLATAVAAKESACSP